MKKFNFKYKNPFLNGPYFNGPHLLGVILIPVGLFFLVAPAFIDDFGSLNSSLAIGIGSLALGVVILLTYGGVIISFRDRKIKEYYSFCGYKTGEWFSLPEGISIELISYSYNSTNTANGISPTLSGKTTEYRTSLYATDGTEPLASFRYTNKDRALKEAKLLSTHLEANLDIRLIGEEESL